MPPVAPPGPKAVAVRVPRETVEIERFVVQMASASKLRLEASFWVIFIMACWVVSELTRSPAAHCEQGAETFATLTPFWTMDVCVKVLSVGLKKMLLPDAFGRMAAPFAPQL